MQTSTLPKELTAQLQKTVQVMNMHVLLVGNKSAGKKRSTNSSSSSSTEPLPPGSPPPAMLMSMTSTGMRTMGMSSRNF